MFDARIREITAPALNGVARMLAASGLRPTHLTLATGGLSLILFLVVGLNQYMLAIILILLGRLLDTLDGPLARVGTDGPTRFGETLDTVTDTLFYGLFVFAFALSTEHALFAAFLLLALLLNTAARQAYQRAARSIDDDMPTPGALMEDTELTLGLILICLMPTLFPVMATLIGILCILSAGQRVLTAMQLDTPILISRQRPPTDI